MNNLESNSLSATSSLDELSSCGASSVVESTSSPTSASMSWSERFLVRVLTPMRRGQLRMVLPDGRVHRFGEGVGGPQAEMRVRSARFFERCFLGGDIGFGESYQMGEWETPDLPGVIEWFCANVAEAPSMSGSRRNRWVLKLFSVVDRLRHWTRRNTLTGSSENIRRHYDLGNEFYRLWLDRTMTYSAGLFGPGCETLEEAQVAKYDRLCRLLRLGSGDHVLEIGSGWGGFASHAARTYGCRVTTITLSEEQHRYATARMASEGVSDRVEVRLQDYREVAGSYDKICSIEMLEAVGDEYLETYFGRVQRLLKPEGLFAAQFITCPDARYEAMRSGVDWIQKHIFPGSLLLSMNRVGEAIQKTGELWLHDLRDLGTDYARTLRLWREQFHAKHGEVRALGFDEQFVRTWDYYLAYCEAAFGSRNISVVQVLWTRPNNGALR